MMKTALIIPTRNGETELASLFTSLSAQTRRCDVFVVDSSVMDKGEEQ
jgi:glycosyltransferase involved in cell wall biosynthesis